MKRLMILTVAILLAGAGTGYAQSQDANSRKMARKQMKAGFLILKLDKNKLNGL